MPSLHVIEWGDGDVAVLVHGSISWGEETWAAQRPLAEKYRLLVVDRYGFGDSPGPDMGNWERDAEAVAELLPDGAHLVGHSYGGVVSLLAAARRPDAVRSLTVVEPPALGLVRGDPIVEEFIRRVTTAQQEATDAADYVRRFFASFGLPPRALPQEEKPLRAAATSWHERSPAEAEIPLEELAAAAFPKLVVRGAWDTAPPEAQRVGRHAMHAVCDVLVERLGAESVTIAGAAHSVPRIGEPFNAVLRDFWERALLRA